MTDRHVLDRHPADDHRAFHFSPEFQAEIDERNARIVPSTRIDGWTGAHQKRFLEAIADGATVTDACRFVGKSVPSAYAFRRRAKGQAFALGWRAADLLARERIAADLLSRALDGHNVTFTRDDGTTIVRHQYDNRLAVQMLNRLDRYADASDRTAPGADARMVAAEFDAYLDLVEQEGGPARAGLFMLARARPDDAAPDLEPVVALARADRLIRCGTAVDGAVPLADLDPARRADWTAEQWARAEAAGLVRLAPPEPEPKETASTPIQPSLCSGSDGDDDGDKRPPVYWCDVFAEYRTGFPPPDGFFGEEDGEYGDADYSRQLDEDEAEALNRPHRLGSAAKRALEEGARDRWFAEAARVDGMDDLDPEDVTLKRFDREALEKLAEWAGKLRDVPDADRGPVASAADPSEGAGEGLEDTTG